MRYFTAMFVVAVAGSLNAEWRYHQSTDLMDDSRFVSALSPQVESSRPADYNPKATLRVGCHPPSRDRHERGHGVCWNGACWATVGYDLRPSLWTTYLNLAGWRHLPYTDGTRVYHQGRVRFDDELPAVMRASADRGRDVVSLGLLTDSHSPSCVLGRNRDGDPCGFVSRLLNADRVLVELPQYGSNPVFEFPVGDDGKGVIRKVINACNTAEAAGRTVWGRDGVLTLIHEHTVRRPRRSWRKRWARQGGMGRDATSLNYHPPLLNAKTGSVVIPYMYGDTVVAVEIGGKEVVFESTDPWRFTVPVTSVLSGPVEVTYSTRTHDKTTIGMWGEYERQYRLSFKAVDAH